MMKSIKNARYLFIIAVIFSLITCNRNALTDLSDLSEIFIPAPGQSAFVSLPGRSLSNGIWNLWTLNNWFEEYFWEINNQCIESATVHVYFDSAKMYFIFTLSSQEHYLVEMDTYEYNRANGLFSLTNKYDSSFNTETGFLGYFNPDVGEGFGYELLHLQKANSFSGVVKNTTINEVIARFAVLSHQYASNGDGVSAGGIQVNVNYSGSYPVSESNPIFIELYDYANVYTHDSKYGGVVTTKTGSTTIKHLPDGNYYILAYVKPSLMLNPDDEIRPGDSHLWYGNAYYADPGMVGSPLNVAISGSLQSISIDFDDAHPFTRKKEAWTTLNSVTANYAAGDVSVTVDIDTSTLGSGSISNQTIYVTLNSPRSYSVKGTPEGEYFWQRGQSLGFSLSHLSGTSWEGTATIDNYLESGNWMVYGIYVSDNVNGTWGDTDDVRVSFEAQARGEITKNYVYTEKDNYDEGQGPCKNNIPICYVNISTSTPDTTGPELLSIIPDKISISVGDMAVVKFTMTDSGSGLPTSSAGRVWLSQVDGYESFNDGVCFDIEFIWPDKYEANVMASALPSMGDWTIRHIMIRDAASNSSNYVLYDDPFWSGNPFGVDGSYYYLFNNEGLLPVKSSVTKVTITKI